MFQRYSTNQTKSRLNALVVVLGVATIGITLLLASHAATPYASINSDTGTMTSPATSHTCAGASDGSCVTFGSAGGSVIWDGKYPCSGELTTASTWPVLYLPYSNASVSGITDPLGSGQCVGDFSVGPQASGVDPASRADYSSADLSNTTMNSNVYVSFPVYVPMSTISTAGYHVGENGNGGFLVAEDNPDDPGPQWGIFAQTLSPSSFQYGFVWIDTLGTYDPAGDEAIQWLGPTITSDGWHTITLRINYAASPSEGYAELWYDGVAQQFTATSYADAPGAPLETGDGGANTRIYYSTYNADDDGEFPVGSGNYGIAYDDDLYSNQSNGTEIIYHGETKLGTTLSSVAPAVSPEGP